MTREQWAALCDRSHALQRRLGSFVYTDREYRTIRGLLTQYSNRAPTERPVGLPRYVRIGEG